MCTPIVAPRSRALLRPTVHEAAAQLIGSLARYAIIGVSRFLGRGTAPAVSGYLGCAMAGLFCALDGSVAGPDTRLRLG